MADGPSVVFIDPRQENYKLGDRLNCSADGNPFPSYQWKNLVSGKIIHGGDLQIWQGMSSTQVLHFQCTASNNFGGMTGNASKNISFTIRENATVNNGKNGLAKNDGCPSCMTSHNVPSF